MTDEQKPKKRKRFKWLKRLFYSVCTLFILVLGVLSFVIFTESGLKFANYIFAKTPLHKIVQIDNLRGTLYRGIRFDHLHVKINDDNYVDIRNVELHWDLNQILSRNVTVDRLSVDQVIVNLSTPFPKKAPNPNSKPFLPFSFDRGQLPVNVEIKTVTAADVSVLLPHMSIFASNAIVQDGLISKTYWIFNEVAAEGQLDFGKAVSWPLRIEGNVNVDKAQDHVLIHVTSATKDMRIKDNIFDHAMNIRVEGKLNDFTLKDSITFNWPSMLAKPLISEVSLQVKDQADVNWDLSILNAQNKLTSKGAWSFHEPMQMIADVKLDVKDLKDTYPDLHGKINGDFSFSGHFLKPLLGGDIKAEEIKGFGLSIRSFDLIAEHNEVQTTRFESAIKALELKEMILESININLLAEKIESFDFKLFAKNLINKDTKLIDSVEITSLGSLADHKTALRIRSIFNTTDFEGIGHLVEDNEKLRWDFDIDKFDVFSDVIGKYHLDKEATLSVEGSNISVSQLCVNNLPTTICLQGQKQAEDISGTFVIRKIQPALLNHFLPKDISIQTTLDLVLSGRFNNLKDFVGVTNLSLSPGKISYRLQGRQVEVPLNKTDLIINARPIEIASKIDVDWGKYLQIHGGGTLTNPATKQLLDIKVTADAPTLDWVLPLIPDVQKLDGKLSAIAELSGNLKKPDLGVNISLSNAQAYIAEYNSSIQDIFITMALKKGTPILTVEGGLKAGEGSMKLSGNFNVANMEVNVSLKGNSLLLANSENIKVVANPDLVYVSKQKKHKLTGGVTIPDFKFIYKSSDDPRGTPVTVSEDTIVISSKDDRESKEKRNPFMENLAINFNVLLGDEVSVGAAGFIAKLTGGLAIEKDYGEPLKAIGAINIGSGVYNILGQELTLDKGKIQFSGFNINNPNIEFQATRAFDNKRTGAKVNVGVRVTGTLKNPKLNLFSRPSMPDNSIVAYLALGTDIDSLTAIEALQIARMAQKISSGNIIDTKSVAGSKKTGSPEVGIIKDLSGNTGLGVGIDLSKRLYVGIGAVLIDNNEGSAFAMARYKFLKYFNIDTEIGSEFSSFDIRFSKEL